MLRNLDELNAFAIDATDGVIGHVKEFYFDDQSWVVRYFVVETGHWLASRKVLIPAISVASPDWTRKVLPVSITKEQVRNSPDIDTDQPVSRQHEGEFLAYYAYPLYWDGVGIWGADVAPNPSAMEMPEFSPAHSVILPVADNVQLAVDDLRENAPPQHDSDPHLRSSKEVEGYRIHATDGEIGHVQGLLIDEKTWAIRYIIVNTSDWWIGHQMLVPPESIKGVSWFDGELSLDQTRQQVRDAPHYEPATPVDRAPGEGIYLLRGRISRDD